MANSIMYLTEAVVGYVGKGRYYDLPLSEILDPTPEDERTVEEVVKDVWAGINRERS